MSHFGQYSKNDKISDNKIMAIPLFENIKGFNIINV